MIALRFVLRILIFLGLSRSEARYQPGMTSLETLTTTFMPFVRRNLVQVNFRKGFWNCYLEEGKNCPIADQCIPNNDSRNDCGTQFGSNSLEVVNFFVIIATILNFYNSAE